MTSVLVAVVAVWLVGAFPGWWQAPLVGWAPLPVMCLLTARWCWRAAGVDGLTRPSRRLWRGLAASMAALALAVVSNAADALLGPDAPTQRMGMLTIAVYLVVVLGTQWCLIRLPGRGVPMGHWLLFGLDSGAVMVTGALFAWHFSFRNDSQWTQVTGSMLPLVAVVVLGFVAIVAFVKVASVGADHVDRGALRLLALAIAGCTATGSMSPLLAAVPHITNTHLSVPVACVLVGLAAERQRRAGAVVPGPRPAATRSRRFSVLPYLAVAATDTLLLVSGSGPDGPVLAAGAVALTALVVVRQIVALAHNNRLLAEVDEARTRLLHQSTHDDLTGLGNRRLLHERVDEALTGLSPDVVHLALIDLDDFKTVNDRLGHHVGDELLTAVARRLSRSAGPARTVVRLGGDEFAVLLAPATAAQADGAVAELAGELQRPVRAGEHELLVRASVGVAGATGCADARELLRRADVAMYAAKDRGKHRVARYEPAMDTSSEEQSLLGAQLRRALDAGELHLLYQPIVDLRDGGIVGAEALVRWDHPERGAVPPSVFVPVAERTGLIVPMGEWILREACRQAVTWQRVPGGDRLRKVSVNVSARQLRDPDFPARVAAILAETGLDAGSLTLEITETAVFGGGTALASVHALHRLGLSIALDDFGTGHSSLGLLQTCPVDVLKVDKSFVDGIVAGTRQTVVAAALIQIADGLRLSAVAEGVETAGQAAQLRAMGYRHAQGYHFARPIPAAAITDLLLAGSAVPVAV